MSLSKEQYETLDKFIADKTPCTDDSLAISNNDLINGKQIYDEMKANMVDGEAEYTIFGEDGMGYTCYALYRPANSEKIYLIVVWIQGLRMWMEIKDNTWF